MNFNWKKNSKTNVQAIILYVKCIGVNFFNENYPEKRVNPTLRTVYTYALTRCNILYFLIEGLTKEMYWLIDWLFFPLLNKILLYYLLVYYFKILKDHHHIIIIIIQTNFSSSSLPNYIPCYILYQARFYTHSNWIRDHGYISTGLTRFITLNIFKITYNVNCIITVFVCRCECVQ